MRLKKILSTLLIACLMIPLSAVSAFAANSTSREITPDTTWYDSNNQQESYTITTAAQLAGLLSLISSNNTFEDITIYLGNDIVMNDTSSENWTENAEKWNGGKLTTIYSFKGTFDGNNHSIIGMYTSTGLFGKFSGTLKNLTIKDSVINSSTDYMVSNVGAFVGSLTGTVENCNLEDTTVTGGTTSQACGGIVGTGGRITNCNVSADCTVSGTNGIGGIVGSNSTVSGCSNAASVTSQTGSVGGIMGVVSSGTNVSVEDCVNTGTITSSTGSNVGGILGNVSLHDVTISDCINEGAVSGNTGVGGIVGRLSTNCKVSGSTSSGSVTGTSNVGGIAGTSNVKQGTQYDQGNPNTIENCTVSAKVSGTSNVGGLLGSNSVSTDATKEATSIKNNVLMPTASVNGTEKTGALIGDNSEMTTDSGTITNNVWSENLGSASGSGVGDALTSADSAVAKQNSSYGSDGKLNNPLPTGEGGSTINSLSDALTQLIAGGDESKVPETLKVTVTYQNNGHGAAVTGQTIVIGDEITLPAMENDGYFTFLGWSDGTTTYAAGTTVGIMKDTTFTAQWRDDTPPYTGKYSYEVFTSVGDNGTLTVDRYATEGDKVTIEVAPDEAYLLDELVVTANGKEVELTDNGDGTYTFTMPSADVRISATFAEDPDWTEPEEPATDVSDIFIDVAPNAWYKDAVQYAYAGGLMTGVSANEFAPDATTTRGMIVSMLARLEGVESANDAGFADVSDEWYATAVNWAASVGVVNGYEDNTFRPNDAITREQLAAILMNYASYKGEDVSARADLSAYTDQPSAWAEETMSWAVAEGLITGVTNDELQPQGNATRAQVAAILQRFLDN